MASRNRQAGIKGEPQRDLAQTEPVNGAKGPPRRPSVDSRREGDPPYGLVEHKPVFEILCASIQSWHSSRLIVRLRPQA
jgi:hypothetical protein